eukprot:865184-Pyramimonas_sp.AAC.1
MMITTTTDDALWLPEDFRRDFLGMSFGVQRVPCGFRRMPAGFWRTPEGVRRIPQEFPMIL